MPSGLRPERMAAPLPQPCRPCSTSTLERPAILTELSELVPSLIVNFGASDEAVVRVLFGDDHPRGRLPFDLPSSMEAVITNRPDVPFDTKNPTYRFGFGLSYS